jgi:uncharacterized membrane protein YjgN (DUF898 family)
MLMAFIVPTLLLLYFDLMDAVQEGNNLYFAFSLAPLLLWPYFHWRQTRFATSGSSLGESAFSFDATLKQFYGCYAKLVLVTIGLSPVIFILLILVFGGFAIAGLSMNNLGKVGMFVVGLLAVFLAFTSLVSQR